MKKSKKILVFIILLIFVIVVTPNFSKAIIEYSDQYIVIGELDYFTGDERAR